MQNGSGKYHRDADRRAHSWLERLPVAAMAEFAIILIKFSLHLLAQFFGNDVIGNRESSRQRVLIVG